MRRFWKRDDAAVDPRRRALELGLDAEDVAVLERLLDAGADLSEPRHVLFYSYAPGPDVAEAMAQEASGRGFSYEIREPLPEFPRQWSVISEQHAVVSPDFIREMADFFDDLARRHGAEYDGWEASV